MGRRMDLSGEQSATISDGLIQEFKFGCRGGILGSHRYLRESNSRCVPLALESMVGW